MTIKATLGLSVFSLSLLGITAAQAGWEDVASSYDVQRLERLEEARAKGMDTADTGSIEKERSLISAMLQLGQQQGEIMGIFFPQVTPEVPNYDDSETRLQWQFRNNLAQGTTDDEIFIAFA